jgi:ubiquinone/menaquinone biosynthesis C-methylase UbiE
MDVKSIRKSVSEAYARAISAAKPSCCKTARTCCGPDSSTKSSVAELIRYDKDDIQSHPEAAASSFGCGNPLAFSGVREGDTVLDLGSGVGFDLLLASDKVGTRGRVIGIDMTDEMIARARKNIKAAGATNIEVRKGLIEELPVESSSVDWVISNCVINLSPEKAKVFKEIHRVLKPGGQISISDIVAEELPEEILNNKELYNSCIAGAISEKDYLAGLTEAGLIDLEVTERLFFETAQIKAAFDDEDSGLAQLFHGLSESERQKAIDRLISQAAGKVWSAKFTAKKPIPSPS